MRYRIIDIERLLERINLNTHAELSDLHAQGIREQIERDNLARVPYWTESLAVGGKEFVSNARSLYKHRRSFATTAVDTGEAKSTWMIREPRSASMVDSGSESEL